MADDDARRAGEARVDAADGADTSAGTDEPAGLTRRRALQVLAAGAAGAAALSAGCAPDAGGPAPGATAGRDLGAPGNPLAAGTPTDPDLIDPVVPWDLVLEESELATLAVLCDMIIPGDERSPAASSLGAHHFIDEWVSAPYDGNREDRVLVRGGIIWLDTESRTRFDAPFAELTHARRTEICDDICYLPDAAPEHRVGARFFDKVRDLTSTAFWTTPEGMDDLGFVGNRPFPAFEGPPREVLERLGLA